MDTAFLDSQIWDLSRDLLAQFREQNAEFFDHVFLPVYCGSHIIPDRGRARQSIIGAHHLAGLHRASREWHARTPRSPPYPVLMLHVIHYDDAELCARATEQYVKSRIAQGKTKLCAQTCKTMLRLAFNRSHVKCAIAIVEASAPMHEEFLAHIEKMCKLPCDCAVADTITSAVANNKIKSRAVLAQV